MHRTRPRLRSAACCHCMDAAQNRSALASLPSLYAESVALPIFATFRAMLKRSRCSARQGDAKRTCPTPSCDLPACNRPRVLPPKFVASCGSRRETSRSLRTRSQRPGSGVRLPQRTSEAGHWRLPPPPAVGQHGVIRPGATAAQAKPAEQALVVHQCVTFSHRRQIVTLPAPPLLSFHGYNCIQCGCVSQNRSVFPIKQRKGL